MYKTLRTLQITQWIPDAQELLKTKSIQLHGSSHGQEGLVWGHCDCDRCTAWEGGLAQLHTQPGQVDKDKGHGDVGSRWKTTKRSMGFDGAMV